MLPTSVEAPLDDGSLAARCAAGESRAWQLLRSRHGRLLESVALRVVDQRRPGDLGEMPTVVGDILARLHDELAGEPEPTRHCELRYRLAVVARRVAESHVQDATPVAHLLGAQLTPAEAFLDELLATDPARRVADALERLAPHAASMVRLRMHGVDREGVARVLGLPQPTIRTDLQRIATRLGELEGNGAAEATSGAWRMLLGCATAEEHVRIALRTEDEASFAESRAKAERTWHAVRERALAHPHPRSPGCVDERLLAGLVDGTVRGAERARVEGHLASCTRCIDGVALLMLDARVLGPLHDARQHPRDVALSAACISTGRFTVASTLAERAAERGARLTPELQRLARIGLALDGEVQPEPPEPSRVVSPLGSNETPPLVAAEALAQGDPHAAARAIDDDAARDTIAARLRLLAVAFGRDPEHAQHLAVEALHRSGSDPGLRMDAELVQALPEDRALPREIVTRRMREILGELVSFLLRRR